MRIASVGLARRPAQRLDDQHLVTPFILSQPLHQPIVKSAHFDDRHILLPVGQGLVQLIAKLLQFRPARADLATKEDIAFVVAERNRHLLAMEVDSEILHSRFSWFKPRRWRLLKTLDEPRWLVARFQENLPCSLFHRISPQRAGDLVLRAEVERT